MHQKLKDLQASILEGFQTASRIPVQPVRFEVLTEHALTDFARELSQRTPACVSPERGTLLLNRARNNSEVLEDVYFKVAAAAEQRPLLPPGADWYLDNFHVIEHHIREIRTSLPKSYERTLPRITEGPYLGLPRVYALAREFLINRDSVVDPYLLASFVAAYQEHSALTIGELWATPIALRLVLIEHLRQLGESCLLRLQTTATVDALVESLVSIELKGTDLVVALAQKLSMPEGTFEHIAVQLLRKLRTFGLRTSAAVHWLEERLKESGADIEALVRIDQAERAADQITIGNCLTSLRNIDALNWRDWFEDLSLVDRILRKDPTITYSNSDFATRDLVRHKIEKLAQSSGLGELDIANAVLKLAESEFILEENNQDLKFRKANVAYFVIAEGSSRLISELGLKTPISQHLSAAICKRKTQLFLGVICSLTLALAYYPMSLLLANGLPLWGMILVGLPFLIIASEVSLQLLQWLAAHFIAPQLLPKLDLSEGIPDSFRTIVTVHGIFRDKETISRFVEGLEVRYLANDDRNLAYVLLADLFDAPTETTPPDSELMQHAENLIQQLNRETEHSPFYLFFRRRKFCAAENRFLGWERKRGKIHEFNQLLLTGQLGSLQPLVGDISKLKDFRFVLTLDADTALPRDCAKRLVATLSHPLNRPIVDEKRQLLDRGFAVIQPRVTTTLVSAHATWFSWIYTGQTGLDPYTNLISNFYQDIFGSCSYLGKGIYDVKAFEACLSGRIPENKLLSHDLFESCFAHTALASDIEVLDDCPSRFNTYSRREHRWVRGDWQLLPWLTPAAPRPTNTKASKMDLLSSWKLADNLRRSLVAPSALLLLTGSLSIFPGSPIFWCSFVLLVLLLPIALGLANSVVAPPRNISVGRYSQSVFDDFLRHLLKAGITLVMLPYQAYVMCHAIVSTLVRVFVTKRHLLEWESAYYAERSLGSSFYSYVKEMLGGVMLVAIVGNIVAWLYPQHLLIATPLLALWLISPIIASILSKPFAKAEFDVTPDSRKYLRKAAFHTWCYFDDYLTAENNYLIPDNIQLAPSVVLALRTSPTNIGLSILACLSGHDLGFATLKHTITTVRGVIDTIGRMDRWQGHLYNWYDVRTLTPLAPRYVSSVDSGNFIGYLMTLESFLQSSEDWLVWSSQFNEHLLDSLMALQMSGNGNVVQFAIKLRQEVTNKSFKICSLQNVLQECSEFLVSHGISLTPQNYTSNNEQRALQFLCHIVSLKELVAWTTLIKQCLDRFPLPVTPKLKAIIDGSQLKISDFNALRPEIYELRSALINSDPALAHQIQVAFEEASENAKQLTSTIEATRLLVKDFLASVSFKPLYDEARDAFVIGFNLEVARRDSNHYDLLASEARLTSLIAIARGEVPQRHWFKLGRTVTDSLGGRALLSWSGTMFEYLMPLILLKDYAGTLLAETHKAIVRAQQNYADQRGVPWGISESAFAGVDFHKTYQYHAFGVPGLGFKRGLSEDLVVSPYSTFLALTIDPSESIENLRALEKEDLIGEYGFYEAIDYTPSRLTVGERGHVVKSFLAHHQGMSLVAVDNLLNANIMQERFHSLPEIKTCELLLQERFPLTTSVIVPNRAEHRFPQEELRASRTTIETSPYTATPRTMLLSNGHYSVLLDNSGSGYSFYDRDLMLTRFREDGVSNHFGSYTLLRDVDSGLTWSNSYQPMRGEADSYRVVFDPAKVEYWRKDDGIITHTEVTVSPNENFEVRTVTLSNTSSRMRRIEITSLAEVALAPTGQDLSHPAFSKMFIETEYVDEFETLICARRPRSQKEETIFYFHTLSMPVCFSETQYETSRHAFLGRGNVAAYADSISKPLSKTVGAVLDPVVSLRTRLDLEPSSSLLASFISGFAKSRDEALHIASRIREGGAVDRVFELATSYADVELRHQQFSVGQMLAFQRLANALFYMVPEWRAPASLLARNTLGQSALWRFGMSGDYPIVLLRVSDPDQAPVAQELVLAHEYLRLRGVAFDLLILNEYPGGYFRNFDEELQFVMRAGGNAAWIEQRGGLFLRGVSQLSDEELVLLEAVSRVILHGANGTLSEQLKFKEDEAPRRRKRPAMPQLSSPKTPVKSRPREFENSVGGFVENGRTYEMDLPAHTLPELPWSNVIANPNFGFLVTESGGGYTWSQNSRENRLTPWTNDPVADTRGEAVYIREVNSGALWCPTPLPIRNPAHHSVRHGFGWSAFESESQDIHSILTMTCHPKLNLKWWHLKLKNTGNLQRKLEIYLYCEWVLGVLRDQNYRHLIPGFDERGQLLYVRNPYNNEFSGRFAAVGSSLSLSGYTGIRSEFVGRHHGLGAPEAINAKTGPVKLSNSAVAGVEPGAGLQLTLTLRPSEEREILFFMAEEANLDSLRTTASVGRSLEAYSKARTESDELWNTHCCAIECKTPDRSFDVLMNGWLLYQTLSCRIYGRSALYQSGGAFGFRDQLQDSLAFLAFQPELTKHQILLHASRQFIEGDVQHWWHPPSGRGTRTRFSDDYLWLPYAVARYMEATGDWSILDIEVPYIEGPLLEPTQHETYMHPRESVVRGSIYEHCLRAIDRSFERGRNGLPLMGVGDWNDGMNEVGIGGQGESAWVAWFLIDLLKRFSKIATRRNEPERSTRYTKEVGLLGLALDSAAWDGAWYKRAFFDDGSPLGSSSNTDCKIDSLTQSWAIIAGTAPQDKTELAMKSLLEKLVDREGRIIKLLSPPFDKGTENPGYIKGYLAGLRENGGQYTHAAAWTIMAVALMGKGKEAFELFKLINPVDLTASEEGLKTYQGEPYVVAGDVYSNPEHLGHVGWTWYTGSAGWLYQVGLHHLVGLKLDQGKFTIDPCIPPSWREYSIRYQRPKCTYNIQILNPDGLSQGVKSITVNGSEISEKLIALDQHSGEVEVKVLMGKLQPI